jgi:hypothetical protein
LEAARAAGEHERLAPAALEVSGLQLLVNFDSEIRLA